MKRIGLVMLMLAVASLARADAVDVSIANARVMIGRGVPAVKLVIREPIRGYRLALKRNDGRELDVKGSGKAGTQRTIRLESEVGHFSWAGTVSIDFPNGSIGEMPLEFETDVAGPLVMKIDKDRDIDLVNRKLVLRMSNPASRVTLKVKMDTGLYAFNGDVPFEGQPANAPLLLTWPEAPGAIMQISVVAHDLVGAYTGTDFFPWAIEIPHEEVVFDSGQALIRPDQQSKLDHSAKLIAEAVDKFGRFADVKLFIAGHTDTVGALESNRTLSLNRASALVRAFKVRGVKIPVFFEGFGEEALALETADEVDELRNRRAQYFVAINPPVVTSAKFAPRWQQLKR